MPRPPKIHKTLRNLLSKFKERRMSNDIKNVGKSELDIVLRTFNAVMRSGNDDMYKRTSI